VRNSVCPHVRFVSADFTTRILRPASFDGVVAFYAFNHVPRAELTPTLATVFDCLSPRRPVDALSGAADTRDAVELEARGTLVRFHWVIARKPDGLGTGSP
jgi:hypothetical protein